MSNEATPAPTGVNGSLAFLWVLAIAGLLGGAVGLASDNEFGPWALGLGGTALLLALTVQALRHTPKS